jgi:hypothetical protein
MPKAEIVIDLENRIVGVYAAEPDDLNVILVDWDSEGVDPHSPNMIQFRRRGTTDSAFVLNTPVLPLRELAGSDTEQVIELAEEQGALAAGISAERDQPAPYDDAALAHLQQLGLV